MGTLKCIKKTKILLVLYPAQGHVTPMPRLASLLVDQGFEAVMVTPAFIHHKITPKIDPKDRISCVSMEEACPGFFAIEKAMENKLPSQLEEVVSKQNEDGEVVGVVVDLLASRAVEVGGRYGVPVAGVLDGNGCFISVDFSSSGVLVRKGLISGDGACIN